MEQKTTQEKISRLDEVIASKIELIAGYINQGLTEYALIELGALNEYRILQIKTMFESLPGKMI